VVQSRCVGMFSFGVFDAFFKEKKKKMMAELWDESSSQGIASLPFGGLLGPAGGPTVNPKNLILRIGGSYTPA